MGTLFLLETVQLLDSSGLYFVIFLFQTCLANQHICFLKWLMNFLGLRGPLGAGFSRMNDLTVIQTSQVTTRDYTLVFIIHQ